MPIDAVLNNLSRNSYTALLQFHALTGCDTTSYFANHTKQLSWKVFKEYHNLLKNLGIDELTEETIKSAEAFVCRMYNVHWTDSINAARHMLFSKTSKPEVMSPTSDALHFHLMRIHNQAMVWRNAHYAISDLPASVEMRWWFMIEAHSDVTESSTRKLPGDDLLWSNAMLNAVNVANYVWGAHQCVPVINRMTIRNLVVISRYNMYDIHDGLCFNAL